MKGVTCVMIHWLRSLSFNFRLELGLLVIAVRLKPSTAVERRQT